MEYSVHWWSAKVAKRILIRSCTITICRSTWSSCRIGSVSSGYPSLLLIITTMETTNPIAWSSTEEADYRNTGANWLPTRRCRFPCFLSSRQENKQTIIVTIHLTTIFVFQIELFLFYHRDLGIDSVLSAIQCLNAQSSCLSIITLYWQSQVTVSL